MAIATLDAYKAALANRRELLSLQVGGTLGTIAGRFYSPVPGGGAVAPAWTFPSAAVVPTSATVGAIRQSNPSSGQLSIIGARASAISSGVALLVDILSHQGGLSGIVTTAQTTNLPTAALTRYASGEGVMLGLVIATQVGTTGTTVSASYTNSAGTSGRTTPLVAFGSTSFRESGRLILLPLQPGDTGVRSVESVTVTATTGTAGNFGVCLFKPLGAIDWNLSMQDAGRGFVAGGFLGGMPTVENNACLTAFYLCGQGLALTSTAQIITAEN